MSNNLDQVIVENLLDEARDNESDGNFSEALSVYRAVQKLKKSPSLKSKINELVSLQDERITKKSESPFHSTPFNTQSDIPHGPRDFNMSSVTPIRNKQLLLNKSTNFDQSINTTIPIVDNERSFDAATYNNLIIEAKDHYQKKTISSLKKASEKYGLAYSLHQDVKLQKRITKISRELELYNIQSMDSNGDNGVHTTEQLNDAIEECVDVEQYNNIIKTAKSRISEEDYIAALELYKKANEMYPSDKLQRRICKITIYVTETIENRDTNSDEIAVASVIEKNEQLNQSTAHLDIDEYCSEIVQKAVNFEKTGHVQNSIDAYREAENLKPCPYFVDKIKDLEGKLQINEEEAELDVEFYNKLIIEGREFLNEGNLSDALKLYEEALQMNYSEKLLNRVNKIKQKMGTLGDSERSKVDENNHRDQDLGESEQIVDDPDIKEYYEATLNNASDKEDNKLFDEAIALYEEANELIPNDKITQKIAELEFYRDSERDKTAEKKNTEDFNVPSTKDKLKYNEYITKGKHAQKELKLEKALSYYKKASQLHVSKKLTDRIVKLEKFLEDEAESEACFTDMGDGFYLENDVHDKLYAYQRLGVKWMWDLYNAQHGGILGDDMGLGKTIQTIIYLQAMLKMEEISTVMLVMPLSLISNWQLEFEKWAPEIRVELFHGTKNERERNIKKVMKRGGVVLTTYGIIEKNVEYLVNSLVRTWDYLILDEGHKIKNPTKTSKAMRNVPCHHRLLISGTPIQNNLKELWALFDFVSRGKLLGTMTTFKMNYITPIERGREKDASKAEARLGTKLAENLRKLIDPFFLRRTKAEIKKNSKNSESNGVSKLGKKNELCVWLKLSTVQQNLYEAFLTLDTVRDAMNTTKSPLAALTVLKKICDHPRLAIKFEALKEVLDADSMNMKPEDHNKLLSTMELPKNPSNSILLSESCKLSVALDLLWFLSSTGHRTILFSTSLKILDYIQSMIGEKELKCCRIDGTVNKPGDRQQIIELFNTDMSYSIFLLTTQVGGVGLNLTSADRVIIYDPNWNPATDSQAVDRAYRIGQTKPVIVYRLLTCGTIEEKIYRKQVFKDSITRQATGDSLDPIRYFTNQEIHELFKLGKTSFSETCAHLEQLHGSARNHNDELKESIRKLAELGGVGCSDHDLLFSHEEEIENTPEERKFVDDMVAQAKRNLALDTAGPRQAHTAGQPGERARGFDPRNTAVPLSSAGREPWEPIRGQSLWNSQIDTVRSDIERIDIRDPPSVQSQMESKVALSRADVITIEDDEEAMREQAVREETRKLSLSDYKKRQMKIYDFVDSPIQQPHHSIRPDYISPIRSKSNPVGLIIDNHIQNTPKKKNITSDDELEDDLETTRYDDLNKPPCLDDSDEEEDRDEEESEDEIKLYYREDGSYEEDGSAEEAPKEDTGDDLAKIMDNFQLSSRKSTEYTDTVQTEDAAQTEDTAVTEDTAQTEDTAVTEDAALVRTPDLRGLSHKDYKDYKIREKKGDKENRRPEQRETREQSNAGHPVTGCCTCGALENARSKGYKVTKCKCMCSAGEEDKYNRYLQRGLDHHKTGNLSKALQYYKAALQFRNDDVTVQRAYLKLKKQNNPS